MYILILRSSGNTLTSHTCLIENYALVAGMALGAMDTLPPGPESLAAAQQYSPRNPDSCITPSFFPFLKTVMLP